VESSEGLPAPFDAALDAIPDYDGFMSVDEIVAACRDLASRAGAVELLAIGESGRGEPIHAVRIGGDGPSAVVYGFPHANEPTGGTTAGHLASRLAADPGLLRASGLSWYVVPCADPDGARMNEGWFDGPFTPSNYALNYYRQPAASQVEWGFPTSYGAFSLERPVPEVRALKGLIDRARPVLLCSLHNTVFSGVYFWVMDEAPALYARLEALAGRVGLRLHRGEPEHSATYALAPGVYRWPPVGDVYRHMSAYFDGDASSIVGMGASCEEYSRTAFGVFPFVIEAPLFDVQGIDDTSPTSTSRREAALREIANARRIQGILRREYEAVRDLFSPAFRGAMERSFRRIEDTMDAREAFVTSDPAFRAPATAAQLADRVDLRRINQVLPVATFARVVEGRYRRADGDDRCRLGRARRRLLSLFGEECRAIDERVRYRPVPVRDQVAVQTGAVFEAALYVKSRQKAG